MRICHIPAFSSVLLSITGTSRYFSAARQSWQRALTACASFVFYYWYFSWSRCLHVSGEPLHILRCVSICKIELIKYTSSPVCVPAYCTFLFALTEAGGACSLTRIKQMLLCPSCWKWNGLCRLVPAVSLSLLFLASFHFNRILLVVFRNKFLSRCLVHCSPAELYCGGWVSWMVRWDSLKEVQRRINYDHWVIYRHRVFFLPPTPLAQLSPIRYSKLSGAEHHISSCYVLSKVTEYSAGR